MPRTLQPQREGERERQLCNLVGWIQRWCTISYRAIMWRLTIAFLSTCRNNMATEQMMTKSPQFMTCDTGSIITVVSHVFLSRQCLWFRGLYRTILAWVGILPLSLSLFCTCLAATNHVSRQWTISSGIWRTTELLASLRMGNVLRPIWFHDTLCCIWYPWRHTVVHDSSCYSCTIRLEALLTFLVRQ